jgi:hypothetical protein
LNSKTSSSGWRRCKAFSAGLNPSPPSVLPAGALPVSSDFISRMIAASGGYCSCAARRAALQLRPSILKGSGTFSSPPVTSFFHCSFAIRASNF